MSVPPIVACVCQPQYARAEARARGDVGRGQHEVDGVRCPSATRPLVMRVGDHGLDLRVAERGALRASVRPLVGAGKKVSRPVGVVAPFAT